MLKQNLGLIIIVCTSANKKHTVCDIASAMSTAAERSYDPITWLKRQHAAKKHNTNESWDEANLGCKHIINI